MSKSVIGLICNVLLVVAWPASVAAGATAKPLVAPPSDPTWQGAGGLYFPLVGGDRVALRREAVEIRVVPRVDRGLHDPDYAAGLEVAIASELENLDDQPVVVELAIPELPAVDGREPPLGKVVFSVDAPRLPVTLRRVPAPATPGWPRAGVYRVARFELPGLSRHRVDVLFTSSLARVDGLYRLRILGALQQRFAPQPLEVFVLKIAFSERVRLVPEHGHRFALLEQPGAQVSFFDDGPATRLEVRLEKASVPPALTLAFRPLLDPDAPERMVSFSPRPLAALGATERRALRLVLDAAHGKLVRDPLLKDLLFTRPFAPCNPVYLVANGRALPPGSLEDVSAALRCAEDCQVERARPRDPYGPDDGPFCPFARPPSAWARPVPTPELAALMKALDGEVNQRRTQQLIEKKKARPPAPPPDPGCSCALPGRGSPPGRTLGTLVLGLGAVLLGLRRPRR